MKYLKSALERFWYKCGEEKFSLKVILAITTLLTLDAITTLDNPPELNGLIILLNAVILVIYMFTEEEEK